MTTGTSRIVNFRVSGVLLAAGLASGIVAAFMLVTSVGSAFSDSFLRHPCATPCSEALDLDAGHYLVFERTGSSTRLGPLSATTEGPATISPSDVVVTSPTGRTLDVGEPGSSESIDRNGTIYVGVVSFRVPVAGPYRVSVDAPGETLVLVAPGLGQTFLKALPGVGLAGFGLVAGVTGLGLLIVAWVRRRSAVEES